MRHSCLAACCLGLLGSACHVGSPSGPTPLVVPADTLPPAVATSRPGVWDSRDELSAWVTNGLSSGPAVVVGEGDAAVIRIDVGSTNVRRHGPAFDPAVIDLQTIRVRYRWADGTNGQYGTHGHFISLDWELQVPAPDVRTGPPYLFIDVVNRTDDWVEQDAIPKFVFTPPFLARSAVLSICGCGDRGTLEIDWIALVRQ